MRTLYYLEESYENLRKNKGRSVLTGFGVAWGIFLLVVLLGVGEGFYHGVFRKFAGYAQNSMRLWGGRRAVGDPVRFTAPLLNKLKANVVGIEEVTPVAEVSATLQYRGEDYPTSIKGVARSYAQIGQLVLGQGRFLNSRDEELTRPVCVIGNDVQATLFKGEDPVGKFISVNGHYFQVVGSLDKEASFNKEEQKAVLITLQTLQKTFNRGVEFVHFRASLQAGAVGQTVEEGMRAYLAEQLRFDKADPYTVFIWNLSKQSQNFKGLFQGVRLFLWIVGTCMLLSGMIGISNMMLVLVKERTQEIGIRKVLGASAQEILMMILSEAVFISLTAGIVGMVLGIGVLQGLNSLIDYSDPTQESLLAHLAFKPSAAITALLLIVLAGAIAGIMPARRATSILPIKALNSE